MRLTLSNDLRAHESRSRSVFEKPGAPEADALLRSVWSGSSVPAPERTLAAVLTATAGGYECTTPDTTGPLLRYWLAEAIPELRPQLLSEVHGLAGAATPAHWAAWLSENPDGDGYRLSGACRIVMPIGVSSVLVRATHGTRHAAVSVPLSAAGVDTDVEPTLDRDLSITTVGFDGTPVPAERVVPLEDRPDVFAELTSLGRLLAAAEMAGAMQWAVEAAVKHAGERSQFGKPLGSFQAVAHSCADMYSMVELCRSLNYAAAAESLPSGAPDEEKATLAALLAHDRAVRVITDAIHIHGAEGLRFDGALHRRLARCQVTRVLWGSKPELSSAALTHLARRISYRIDAGLS
jgi:alkylation response protein AidB-like acyl-CoA dehydrogenase